jgi:hypothetical protein
VFTPAKEVRSPLSYCPRSSLPAKVLTWLAGRLAHLLPPRRPGRGGNPPLCLEVRLDAVAAVVLDGLSYRRAGRMVGISARAGRDRRTKDRLSDGQRAFNRCQARLRALVEQSIGHLANAWALRRWRGLLYRVRDVYRAAAALICLGRWLHRVPT